MEMYLATDDLKNFIPSTPRAIKEAKEKLTMSWNDFAEVMARMPTSRQNLTKLRSWLAYEMNKPTAARAYVVERILARMNTMRRKLEVDALNEIVDAAIQENRMRLRRESASADQETEEATA